MKRLSVLASGVLLVLMMHAWGGCAVNVSPRASCEPDCTGVEDSGKVVNPRNCSEFYRCYGEEAIPPAEACKGTTSWDDATGDCTEDGTCTLICGPGANCPLTCNGTFSVIGDAFDCSIYYVCTPDGVAELQCSDSGTYFNANTGECEDDESVCCTGFCDPACDGSAAVAADPSNCNNFFFCENGEIVEPSRPCPNDGYFNVQEGGCVSGSGPCQALCDEGGTGDGSSTTTTTTTTTTPGGSGGYSTTSGSGASTDINGCVSSLVCTGPGDFAACNSCQPVYYECNGAGEPGKLQRCPDGYVFNPVPERPFCVFPNECPKYS